MRCFVLLPRSRSGTLLPGSPSAADTCPDRHISVIHPLPHPSHPISDPDRPTHTASGASAGSPRPPPSRQPRPPPLLTQPPRLRPNTSLILSCLPRHRLTSPPASISPWLVRRRVGDCSPSWRTPRPLGVSTLRVPVPALCTRSCARTHRLRWFLHLLPGTATSISSHWNV